VKESVDFCGGSIQFDDQQQEGLTITVIMPTLEPTNQTNPPRIIGL
jgi:sensor histidine kinase regulating citrate/malate metabolism